MKQFIKNGFEYFTGFLIYLSIPPFFMWHTPYLSIILSLLFFLLSFVYCKKIGKDNVSIFITLFLLFAYFAIWDGGNIFRIITTMLLCSLILFPTDYLCKIFERFTTIYAALMIPSIIVYISIMFLGISSLPSKIIEPLNILKDYDYTQYPFLVMINRVDVGMFRFMAYFDEPGVVGTISGVLLFMHGLRLNRWETYPILISGIFSLSLAFYLMLFVNILLFQSFKVKFVFILLLSALAVYFATDEVVGKLIFERLEIEDGELAGINRTTSTMDTFMKRFVSSDKFWFGYGNNYAQEIVNEGGASYKDLLVNYGIIGFLLLIFTSVIFAIKRFGISIEFLIYVVVWASIIYQRPFIFSLIYFFLLYIPLFYLKDKQNKRLYHYE